MSLTTEYRHDSGRRGEIRFLKIEETKTIRLLRAKIRSIGIPKGEEREKEAESIFIEIIVEYFANLGKELDTQVHKAN